MVYMDALVHWIAQYSLQRKTKQEGDKIFEEH